MIKRSKLAIFLLIGSIICILLKLLISYLFPFSRLLLWFLLIPAMLICLAAFMIKNGKALINPQIWRCALLSIIAVVFTLLPIDRELELARFHVAKGFFYSAAQNVEKQISSAEGTEYGRFPLKFPQNMLNPGYGSVDYYKHGESVAILFPVSQSLSTVRYLCYLSDSKAKDLLENPRKYGFNRDGFPRIEKLDDSQWMYVFYWGDIRQKDPNL
ncbi:hypothetical protein [Caproicibacter fermentans]|uniref:Uncharacterized protein n=1 Tax=Caproicibacter fermentans TaxID=2576756 RepID=A0A7G8T6U5_9FIRM|nr:hypothetical protein [Caproicibacter fermentans]QNK39336.1 hypothetical protein HCR03_11260 [Caproicibacter fermentans]